MVSTASDGDATCRLRRQRGGSQLQAEFRADQFAAPRCAQSGDSTDAHGLNGDLSRAKKCSFEKLTAELNAAFLLRLTWQQSAFRVDMTPYPSIRPMETGGDAVAI